MLNKHDLKDYDQLPFDPVEKPKHYMLFPDKGIEIRDVLEKLVNKIPSASPMFAADYVQAMQYGMRFMEKNGLEDLKKMRWYLDKLIGSYDKQSKISVGNTRSREFGCVYGSCLKSREPAQPCYCTQITGVPSKE